MGILKSYEYSDFPEGVDLQKLNTEIRQSYCVEVFSTVLIDAQVHILGESVVDETELDTIVDTHPKSSWGSAEDMTLRKKKLSDLLRSMELNPLIDAQIGKALFRSLTEYVESYKYTVSGYDDLMDVLSAKALDTNDTYYSFLNGPTATPDDGVHSVDGNTRNFGMNEIIFTHRPPTKKPISWANRGTRIKTGGVVDHVAYMEDGIVYESVIGYGVHDEPFGKWKRGREGTILFIFKVPHKMYSLDIYQLHRGKKYDSPAIIWLFTGMYNRLKHNADKKQFCSELVCNMRSGIEAHFQTPMMEFEYLLNLDIQPKVERI